jgi:hypothetical protein
VRSIQRKKTRGTTNNGVFKKKPQPKRDVIRHRKNKTTRENQSCDENDDKQRNQKIVQESLFSSTQGPPSFPIDSEQWRVLQQNDDYCNKLIDVIECDSLNKMQNGSYIEKNGVLRLANKTRHSCIDVPVAARADVLRVLHDHPLNDHLGFNRTMFKVKGRYFGPKW